MSKRMAWLTKTLILTLIIQVIFFGLAGKYMSGSDRFGFIESFITYWPAIMILFSAELIPAPNPRHFFCLGIIAGMAAFYLYILKLPPGHVETAGWLFSAILFFVWVETHENVKLWKTVQEMRGKLLE